MRDIISKSFAEVLMYEAINLRQDALFIDYRSLIAPFLFSFSYLAYCFHSNRARRPAFCAAEADMALRPQALKSILFGTLGLAMQARA